MASNTQLAWTSKNKWDSTDNTHRAEANGWKYSVDQPRANGEWQVRGWGPDNKFLFRTARTMRAAKELASDHNKTA